MKTLFFIIAFVLIGSLSFASSTIEKKETLTPPCFVIVQTENEDGTDTLHGSIYTGVDGCDGTVVVTYS